MKRQHSDVYVRRAREGGFRARSFAKLLEVQERFALLREGSLVLELGAAPGGWSQLAVEHVYSRGIALPCPAVIHLDVPAPLLAPAAPPPRARRSIFSLGGEERPGSDAGKGAPSPLPAGGLLPQVRPLQCLPLVVALDLLPIEPIPGVQVVQGDGLRGDLVSVLTERVFSAHGRMPSVLLCDMAPSFTGEGGTDQLRQVGLACAALRGAVQGALKEGGSLCVKARYGEGYDKLRALLRARFEHLHEVKPPSSRSPSPECYFVGLGFLPAPFTPLEAAFLSHFY